MDSVPTVSNNSSSGFSVRTLEQLQAVFHSNSKYNSCIINGDIMFTLISWLTNPSYQALSVFPKNIVYNGLLQSLQKFVDDVSNRTIDYGTFTDLRVQVILPDGTVMFDTYKTNNSYENFLTRSITENRGGCQYYQSAVHTGVGYETMWSSTTGGLESVYASRMGQSKQMAIGVVAISYTNTY